MLDKIMDYIHPDTFGEGLLVTIVGLLIVFAVLLLIMGILSLMPYISGKKVRSGEKEKAPAKQAPEKAEAVQANSSAKPGLSPSDTEIAAVISAVIACLDNGSTRYRIKSFRRVSTWRAASLSEQLGNLK